MKNFVIEELMKGVKSRHVGQENNKLIENWTKTGLLRGLDGHKRETMARLLQNQLSELIRESNQVSLGAGGLTNSGQLQGVTTVTFPLVRRIFGGLVSSEIVSMQAMALPSGLIFFLDFTYGSNVGGDAGVDLSSSSTNETYTRGQSIYGNPVGKGIQSGSLTAGGAYDLVGTGFSLLHSGSAAVSGTTSLVGSYAGAAGVWSAGTTVSTQGDFSGSNARWTNFDPQLETGVSEGTFDFAFVYLTVAELTSKIANLDVNYVDQLAITAFATTNGAVQWGEAFQAGTGVLNLRRLNRRGDFDGSTFTPNPMNGTHIQFVIRLSNGGSVPVIGATTKVSGILSGLLTVDSGTGSTLTIPSFESNFGTPASPVIPEVDIKIESIAITTTTRKLRARWTPELSQDMNAYHSLDAEVELTQVLSQQIALEIDREILQDLLQGANGANFYWSRAPGRFVNKKNGQPASLASSLSIGPQFTGNVREWYEILVETVIDVGNTIHRKTLRGSANFLVTSSDVCTIFEASVMYKPKLSIDGDGQVAAPFQIGAEAVGTLSNRFTVYKDPMFPVNRILVGYKGGTALETGYVYAPYVPLIMTPTLYGQEDFTPRRGVMTRYGKKMIRSDFYGTVTVLDMNIILSGLQSVTTETLSKPGVDRLQACLYLKHSTVYSLRMIDGLQNIRQICKICGYDCANRKSLGMHLFHSHKMKAQDYFDKYIREEIKRCKCGCGTETQWHQSHSSYNDYITGHNEAGFKVKQPVMTRARREKMKQTAIETYAKLGDEYKKKISDGVKKSFQKEEVKKKHSDSIKAHWAIPANKKRLCEIRQRVWNEQHDDLVKKIFTPEFGEKISKANSERDVKKVSNAEIAFGNFISNIFGSDAVKRSVWEKVADKHRCFDFRVNTDNGTYTIEFDGHYWHGLDRKAMWNPIQLRNIAADQIKNAHCIANDLKLIRISETADLSTVTDITSLIAAAYHYSDGHETIKSRPRPFSAGILFSKDESQSTPDDIKESVILPALMSLCVDEIELHGDTWLSRYEQNESLSDVFSELRSPSLAFNSSAGSSYLRNTVQSYWKTAGGFNESSCDLKKLDSVLRYRLGLGKTREIFDISAEEIKRGFIVQHAAPSWFKPAWAVHIWKELVGEIVSPTAWDPSGGWGARMLGFTAAYPKGTYHCTEPATATYRDLVTLQDILRPGDSTHVYHQGSEHSCDQIEDESCDAIFTSPPYFDRERWWNEPGQCWRDYPTLESWESEYVIPTVANALMKLKQGGMFAINTTPEFSESWLSAARAIGFKFLYERELSSGSSHFQRAQGKKTRKNPEMLYVWTRITLGTIMKKAWLLSPKEDWIVDRFCQEWHSDNPDMSTLNPQECDVVWLIADWCWRQVPEAFLRSKRVLTTVHHMVPEKMTRASYDDFEARDRFTHAYHVPNIHTAQQVRAIVGQSKPVYVIPYWCNPRIWYPENRTEMRQKHGIPETAYVLGSFQRDTEGGDLRSPKLEKGPDLVADYVEGLKRTDTFVVLAGWRRQYIISRLESAEIRYKYFEKPSQSTLRELYATLDLYPIGARYEGGPQALTECGLMGIPCISRPVGIAEAVLPAESIAYDLSDAKPAVPSVVDMTIPYGYRAFRQMLGIV